MKGYKVFNSDWTCRGFQYEVGKTYKEECSPILCFVGFHFCEKVADCFNFYDFNPNNKVAEVEALGEVVTADDGRKSCTNEIRIVREVSWEEMLTLANSGKGNTGRNNSGNYNTGNRNSGNYNTGNCNSGNCNSGDWNSGNYNTGNYNSGDWNSGNWNSGDYNTGNYNSGNYNTVNCNSGDWNSGDYNTGNRNSGDWNSGNYNTGDWNSGNYNTGDWNSGDYNTGNRNSGDWNSGDWNKTNYSSGFFCTEEPKVLFFDKESDWTHNRWSCCDARDVLNTMPNYSTCAYTYFSDMTDSEKEAHPEAETTGGYIEIVTATDADRQKWWDELSGEDKALILALPNFDANKFTEITGINTYERG